MFFIEIEHYIPDHILLNKMATLDIAIIENPNFNNLFLRASGSGQARMTNILSRTPATFSSMFTLVSTMVSVFWFSPIAGLVLLITSIPELVIENIFAKKTYGIYARNSEVMRKRSVFRQLFSSPSPLTELRLYSTARYFIEKTRDLMQEFLSATRKDRKDYLIISSITLTLSQI